MKKIFGGRIRRLATVVVAGALSSVFVASAAHADHGNSGLYGNHFVDGGGVLTDDFGDHYSELGNSLCYGCPDSRGTDLVKMWELILFAEGLLPSTYVDGTFGIRERDATKELQRRYKILADGKVGPNTWGRADDRLRWWQPIGANQNTVYYSGTGGGRVWFTRGSVNKLRDGGAYGITSAWTPAFGSSFEIESWSHQIFFNRITS